jgi:hypothetical protein
MVTLYLVNCTLINALFVFKTLYKNQNKHQLVKSWISRTRNSVESSLNESLSLEKQPTPRGSKQDSTGRLFWDFRLDILENAAVAGLGKKFSAKTMQSLCYPKVQ